MVVDVYSRRSLLTVVDVYSRRSLLTVVDAVPSFQWDQK